MIDSSLFEIIAMMQKKGGVMTLIIRFAKLTDAQKLIDIYRYYVDKTAVTFEYDVPSLTEFQKRMTKIMAFYPYLVAEENGVILGYAYASSFHSRPAYAWSTEVSIYLDKDKRRCGVGRRLYYALEYYLAQMGILNSNACIARTTIENPYLTNASETFHYRMGYQLVGTFHNSGYKFNQWYDMIWMEKMLGEHSDNVASVKSIHEVSDCHK